MARLACLLALVFMAPRSAFSADEEFFERNIRPVLVEKCLSCHSASKSKGGLRLDTRENMLKGGDGGSVVTLGKPKESRLIDAIKHIGDLKMPQSKKLADREIAALEQWVARGAPWPAKATLAAPDKIALAARSHWAFRVIRRPAVPTIQNAAFAIRNPIDAFVAARLSESGLTPSKVASKRTLIRRATFDLHGLPPTPEEIAAFLKDDSSNAYEKLLDRLLASPRYGERWARHWLDIARYADNKGYVFFEGKDYPWAWTYRDYVISAFNRDLPYDRFILEQLAADQLGSGDSQTLAALGFLTVGGHFLNNTHDILDDRIDVVTRGLMGLTVVCARCHDHKFDPIPSADYYSLYGVFRSSTEPKIPPVWGKPPTSGQYVMFNAELQVRQKRLEGFVASKHAALVNGARTRIAEYLMAVYKARNAPPADDFMLISDPGDLNPSMIARWRQYLEDAKKHRNPIWLHWNAYSEGNFAAKVEGSNPLIRAAFITPPSSMKEVAERYAKTLVAINAQWKAAEARGAKRLADPDAEELRRVLYGPGSPADAPLALDWGFLSLFPDRAAQGVYQKHLRAVETWIAKGPPRVMSLIDMPLPYEPRVFERGNPGRPGKPVPRQFLQVANPSRKPFTQGSGRLELAKEIASRNNPLTARVQVNRVWMHHFGKPLVGTPGDFGLRSDPPTHPKLLDWLAAEFMEPSTQPAGQPWALKRLHKLIMMSATYKQASLDRPECLRKDSENSLLWKQNRRRLEFEPLHDSLLAVSGRLSSQMGGKPVSLPSSSRRAVYGYIDRLEFPTLLTTFDVPNPAGSVPERTSTTVAPQSLFLMNGPFARAAARNLLAKPAFQKARDGSARLDAIFLTLFGRPPSDEERKLALALVQKGPDRWVDLVHGLMMTNEFAFVD